MGWNENFEFHGSLKSLLANKLEVHVRDYDIGGKNAGHSTAAAAENDLGSATFDLTSMGKYVKHEFTLWYAQNNGGSGGSHTAWKSYRMAYKDKSGGEHYHTVLGVEAENVTRYEYSVSTLEHGTIAMRCESSQDFKEWTTL